MSALPSAPAGVANDRPTAQSSRPDTAATSGQQPHPAAAAPDTPAAADHSAVPAAAGLATSCRPCSVLEGTVVRVNNYSANIFFFDVLVDSHAATETQSAAPPDTAAAVTETQDTQLAVTETQTTAASDTTAVVTETQNTAAAAAAVTETETAAAAAAMSFVLKVGASYESKQLTSVTLHSLASTITEGVRVRVNSTSDQNQVSEEQTYRATSIHILSGTSSMEGLVCQVAPVVENGVGKDGVNLHRRPKQGWCKYWLNSKRCSLVSCTQPHPTGEAWTAARAEWHAARYCSHCVHIVLAMYSHGAVIVFVLNCVLTAAALCSQCIQHCALTVISIVPLIMRPSCTHGAHMVHIVLIMRLSCSRCAYELALCSYTVLALCSHCARTVISTMHTLRSHCAQQGRET